MLRLIGFIAVVYVGWITGIIPAVLLVIAGVLATVAMI
jgi:hypothetical protein